MHMHRKSQKQGGQSCIMYYRLLSVLCIPFTETSPKGLSMYIYWAVCTVYVVYTKARLFKSASKICTVQLYNCTNILRNEYSASIFPVHESVRK